MKITKTMYTETGHRLVDYDGRCAHLHGHSYKWEVTVTAEHLTDNGMVADFKHVKKAMVAVIDPLDHCMVLSPEDPLLRNVARGDVGALALMLKATNNEAPRLEIWHNNPTAESFAAWAAEELQRYFWETDGIEDVTVDQVRVWETATSYAEWNRE